MTWLLFCTYIKFTLSSNWPLIRCYSYRGAGAECHYSAVLLHVDVKWRVEMQRFKILDCYGDNLRVNVMVGKPISYTAVADWEQKDRTCDSVYCPN